MKMSDEEKKVETEDLIGFLARDIGQKIMQLYGGKPEKIRKKLDDTVHILELQNRLTSIVLFTMGMKAAVMGAGQTVGSAIASYMTLCCDVAQKIKEFQSATTLQEAKNSELVKMLKELFEKTGLGIFELEEFEKDKRIVVSVEECVESAGLPNVGKKVCYYMTGYLEGLFTVFLGKEVKCHEIKCVAKGDEKCIFEIEVIE